MPQRDSTSHPQGRLGQERQAAADAGASVDSPHAWVRGRVAVSLVPEPSPRRGGRKACGRLGRQPGGSAWRSTVSIRLSISTPRHLPERKHIRGKLTHESAQRYLQHKIAEPPKNLCADEWINNVLGPHGGTLLSNKKERSTDVDTMRTELENMPCAQNQSQNHHIVHGFLCMKCLEKANLWRKEVGE